MNDFDPDKRLETKESSTMNEKESTYNPDQRVETLDSEGAIKSYNPEDRLDDQFKSTYDLKENTEYESNGYNYETDGKGRIKEASGTLRLEEGKRFGKHQLEAGGEDCRVTDEGGHLISSMFGGSGKIDNLVAMDKDLNRKDYKALENKWAKEIEAGNKVDVKINLSYKGNSERPDRFRVSYSVTDKSGHVDYYAKTFRNGG
ncbi:MAG: DNA/RNA non-specific endonuclease [Erysipelotrichaceae bacterium]|nr:DNA/RNA non-specific endonuclease [Erysipelotrichaceae bacterium]